MAKAQAERQAMSKLDNIKQDQEARAAALQVWGRRQDEVRCVCGGRMRSGVRWGSWGGGGED